MKERDLYILQELAKEGKNKLIHFSQKGYYAVIAATNGYCYMQLKEKNLKRFTEGFFDFTGRCIHEQVQLPQGYEILSSDGKKIGTHHYNDSFDIPIGSKGEFHLTFNRIEVLNWLKKYLTGWKSSASEKYMLVIHRFNNQWKMRGYSGSKVWLLDVEANPSDTITDSNFRVTVNPHTFKNIFKWFEAPEITLYFHNGNYECRRPIFMEEDKKLAVLMPIARRK